jgi:hypothetical protein
MPTRPTGLIFLFDDVPHASTTCRVNIPGGTFTATHLAFPIHFSPIRYFRLLPLFLPYPGRVHRGLCFCFFAGAPSDRGRSLFQLGGDDEHRPALITEPVRSPSYFFCCYFHSLRPFPYSKFPILLLFSLVSRPLLFPSSVPGNQFHRLHSWNVPRTELFECSPFIHITLLLYILLMYSSSNRFDTSLSPQIPYDALALRRHLDAHSRLVPRLPRSRVLLFLHRTCLR